MPTILRFRNLRIVIYPHDHNPALIQTCYPVPGTRSMVTRQEFDEATQRGDEMYRTLPHAVAVRFDRSTRLITIDLKRGYSISFPPERAEDLQSATDEELAEIEIAGVWGIHLPHIDADLWVPALVQGRFGNEKWEAAWSSAHATDQAA